MTSSSAQPGHHEHARGLLIIGILKLLKAALFVAIGIGVLRLLHHDIADLAMRVALALKFDPESHFVNTVLDRAQRITDSRLREISLASLAYACVACVEGVGLLKEKVWAEYLTIVLTASFLPWELVEIIHHLTWMKVVVTMINIAVLLYLLWYVQRMRKKYFHQPAHAGVASARSAT